MTTSFALTNDLLQAPSLQALPWLRHGFGTRAAAPLDPAHTATLKQIHSDIVVIARQPGVLGQGDALCTNTPGLTVAVRTADCLSLLLADPRHRVVAAVHAGWRGTVSGIAAATVLRMGTEWGTKPGDLVVACGPAILPCCFEVGPEVAVQFAALFPERGDLNQHTQIDLVEANRRHLARVGVAPHQIAVSDACTRCDAERFHSHRRDREQAGRLVSFIGVV